MYIIFNKDGSIKKQFINDFIQQGDNNVKTIFVTIEDFDQDEYAVGAVATLPDGTMLTLPNLDAQKTIDGVSYEGKEVFITSNATILAGTLKLNLVATNNNETLVTYTLYLTINETGLGANDIINMTVDEYLNLLDKINQDMANFVPYTSALYDVDLGTHKLSASSLVAYEGTYGIEVTNYGIVHYNYGEDFREDTFEFPEYTDIPGHEFTLATENWVSAKFYDKDENDALLALKADKNGPLPEITGLTFSTNILTFITTNNLSGKPFIFTASGFKFRALITIAGATGIFYFDQINGNTRYSSSSYIDLTNKTLSDLFAAQYDHSFELAENKSTTINASSTDTEYPSSKAVYTSEQNLRSALQTAINQSGHSVDLSIDSNYDMVLKLIDANGNIISQDDIDLPLESIVVSATYYDTYTYDGTTYSKVIVIVLATTDVPTIVPVGDLVNGLVNESTFNSAMALKADKDDTYTKTETNTFLGAKADKEGPLPEINESTSTNVFTFITNNDVSGKTIILTLTGTVGGSYIGAFTKVTPTQYSCEFEKIGSAIRIVVDNISSSMTLNNVFNNNSYRQNYEVVNNKVTSVSASSTDTEYPSAKLLYDQLALKADKNGPLSFLPSVTGNENITDILTNNNLIDKPFICSCSSLNTHLYRCLFHWNETGYYFGFEIEDLITGDRWCRENAYLHLIPFSYILTNYTKNNYEITNNKVTSISASSTDTEYPSAKCVWDKVKQALDTANGKNAAYILDYSWNLAYLKSLNQATADFRDENGNNITSAIFNGDYDSFSNSINSQFNTQDDVLTITRTNGLLVLATNTNNDLGETSLHYFLVIKVTNSTLSLPSILKVGTDIYVANRGSLDRWFDGAMTFYAYDGKTDLSGYVPITWFTDVSIEED